MGLFLIRGLPCSSKAVGLSEPKVPDLGPKGRPAEEDKRRRGPFCFLQALLGVACVFCHHNVNKKLRGYRLSCLAL